MAIIFPLLIMATLSALLGYLLAAAARKFKVETDPRIEQLLAIFPGANCGACGFAGCSGYAAALTGKTVKKIPTNLCVPGGKNIALQTADILGIERSESLVARAAVVACDGDGVKMRFRYRGISTCNAASVMGLAGAFQNCSFGCLGLGSCIEQCPFGALKFNKNNVAEVDEEVCVGCGKCVTACPRRLISLRPFTRAVTVRCSNHDRGARARMQCNHSCVACGRCITTCPRDAVKIREQLAVIDYNRCDYCGICATACPQKVINNHKNQPPVAAEKLSIGNAAAH